MFSCVIFFSLFLFCSIHNAVISVFQRKDLGENELYTLNEGVRLALCQQLNLFFFFTLSLFVFEEYVTKLQRFPL